MQTINAFNDVTRSELPTPDNVAGLDDLRSVAALEVGHGARSFKGDSSGIWMGANTFANAPFKVDMDGNIYLESADGKLVIDAVNNRIVVYDASGVPRVLLGYQLNGF